MGAGAGREASRFFADAMLGKLARWLRTLGYDVAYERHIDDRELVQSAKRQGRIILTRDRLLVKRKAAAGISFLVGYDDVGSQLREVYKHFSLDATRALTRCLRCNVVTEKIERDAVKGRVPDYVFKTQTDFMECRLCGRVYWAGTHKAEMLKALGEMLGGDMDGMDGDYVIVFMTASGVEEAERIGEKVVIERLAACCNVIPIAKSIYVWKGKLCKEPEALCIFKTIRARFEGLKKRIKELHSYEVPEIIAVPIEAGLDEYLGWIDESVKE